MAVKSNNVLKLLTAAAVLTAGGGIYWSKHHRAAEVSTPAAELAPAAENIAPLSMTGDENKKMTADGDTDKDTVATLIAQVKNLKSELGVVKDQNLKLQNENKDLSQMEGNITGRLDQKFRTENEKQVAQQQQTEQELQKTKSVLQSFEERLSKLNPNLHIPSTEAATTSTPNSVATGQTDIPVGLGLHPGEGGSTWTGSPTLSSESSPGGIIWTDPVNKTSIPVATKLSDKAKSLLPSNGGSGLTDSNSTATAVTDRVTQKLAQDIPVYTINRDATLIGSVTMTALIGRVPISGQVQDPYKFKLLVGPENLAANGIKIPGLDSMVISGVGTGDWGLSCVRGDITSATFVFQDGTIRSYPKPERNASSSTGTTAAKKTFGYISDKFGIPCVTGERKSNAVEFLSVRIGLAAAQAAAEAAAAAETTTVASGQTGAIASAVTGSPSSYAKNKAISSGIQESSSWIKERQAQSFDAIFVRNGAEVAVHIDEEIPIDYEPTGRKVSHHAKLDFAESSANRNSLD